MDIKKLLCEKGNPHGGKGVGKGWGIYAFPEWMNNAGKDLAPHWGDF
jgi:hypothetical protein